MTEWMTALRSLIMSVSSGSAGENFSSECVGHGDTLDGNMDDVEVILVQLEEHALKSRWGLGKWLPGNDLQWFVVSLDGDILAVAMYW